MPADEYSLRHYVAANGKRPFAEWLCSLPDRNAAARVQIRLERLRLGNFAAGTRPVNSRTFAARENTSPTTGGGQMPRSASYDDLLKDMLKDGERARAYLNAALDEQ